MIPGRRYRVVEGGMHDRFQRSRTKIQLIGGGFANGKTTAMVIKALMLARDYPNSNGLVARETYPKLNDTIRKELLDWCPSAWIKKRPTKDDNTLYLVNGSRINFRYIAQQTKGSGEGTSNLLSATYDWVVVDQIEDPGIKEKDFLDLMGRLRGNAEYVGDDRDMPRTGPRWIILACNPTRNWVYQKLVKPYHDYLLGKKNDNLIVDPDTGMPMIEVFEGSTYENADNLGQDYLRGLEATYTGDMRARFLEGKWQAYEGLVLPMMDELIHVVPHDTIVAYLNRLRKGGWVPSWSEGYDYGMSVPSCYGLAATDHMRNTIIVDGFYQPEMIIEDQANKIISIRKEFGVPTNNTIYADPQCFKRSPGSLKEVGKTVVSMFEDAHVRHFTRGNNQKTPGITKLRSLMSLHKYHRNPFTGLYGAPYLYVSDRCVWWSEEANAYYWKRNSAGELTDEPVDKKDHAMDMTRYLLTRHQVAAAYNKHEDVDYRPSYMTWREFEEQKEVRSARYG